MILRIRVNSVKGDRVRVNLPMPLVKVCLEMGISIGNMSSSGSEKLKDIDFSQIMDLAEKGVMGRLVEVETAEGDSVEVVIE